LSLFNVDELQRLKGLVVKLENAYKDAQYRNQIIESNYQKKSLDHDELVERIMGEKKVSSKAEVMLKELLYSLDVNVFTGSRCQSYLPLYTKPRCIEIFRTDQERTYQCGRKYSRSWHRVSYT
jgi:hypothetical protein